MSIQRFPGDFRMGVLDEPRAGVLDSRPDRVEPKLMVFLLLSGHQRFVLGGERVEMRAGPLPDGALFRIGRPTEVVFEHNQGAPLTKLSLAMPPDWLDKVDEAGDLRAGGVLTGLPADFAVLRFLPGAALMETARAILRETAPLRRMALGMALFDQVVAGLEGKDPATLTLGAAPLAMRLRREIAAATGARLTAEQLARRLGIGLRSLERQIRAAEGCSLGAFLRDARLELAFRALRAGAPVAEAATRAGYGSAANFSTALRQRYGLTPSAVRAGAWPG